MQKRLALFDFDGTITSKDTLFDIAKFSAGQYVYLMKLALLVPVFALMAISIMSKQRGKEMFLMIFFSGMSERDFEAVCRKYCQERLPKIIRPKAYKAIQDYKKDQTEVIIVSASPKNWIEPWAETLNLKVFGTNLELRKGKITGKIIGKNCNGTEKVERIKAGVDLTKFDYVSAYGDTSGDLPMLELADEKNFKPFI